MMLRISSDARLTNYYQSWLNSRGSYTPQEPINSSSRIELRERLKEAVMGHKADIGHGARIRQALEASSKRHQEN